MAGVPHAESTAGPRFVHLIPTALGRGSQVFARALADELGGDAAGHRLVSLFGRGADVRVDDALRLPGGEDASGLHPLAVRRLSRRLRTLRPDVVIAHGGDAFKYAALATGVPIVYCVIGTWPADARRLIRRALWRTLVRRATVAAAVSDDVAADCRRVLGLQPPRLVMIPNGRDADRYRPAPNRDPAPPRPAHLAFVGHLAAGKRPGRFVDMVQALRERGAEITASITGDGPLRAELEARAAAANIEMTGWTADVVPLLQKADLLVFPSAPDGEGMPGVLIEAGLCGLPVVATRVAGASTVVEDGATGLLVPIDEFDALVDAAQTLVGSPEQRTSMGRAARVHCEAAFGLPAVAQRWDALLRSLVRSEPAAFTQVSVPPSPPPVPR